MKIKMLCKTLVILSGVVGCASTALAANLVEISGRNTRFIYDADFWGNGNVTVDGDSISFSTGNLYSALAHVDLDQEPDYTAETWTTNGTFRGVLAVANDHYKLNASIGNSIDGQYKVDAGGQLITYSNGYVSGGSWSGGVYSEESVLGNYHSQFALNSSATGAAEGSWNSASSSSGPAQRYSALALSLGLTGWVQQSGPGESSASIQRVTFSFSAFDENLPPVSSVPEPSTYALMLAGLGMLGIASRRKAGKAA